MIPMHPQMKPRHPIALLAGSLLVLFVVGGSCSFPGQERSSARPPASAGLEQPDEVWILGRERDGEWTGKDGRNLSRSYSAQACFVGHPGRQPSDEDEADGVRIDEIPGGGGLVTTDPASGRTIAVPLEHTSVRGEVRGTLATVDVEQRFTNPYDTKIEAVYVFPLPDDSAVHDFLMKVGERTIRGIVREREEAERIYAQARAQGFVASLLTEERPNVFTQKVANIEPGHSIGISIRYFDLLPLVDGWYEFVFPMVVGPRFNPPGTSTGIGAVAHGASGSSGQDAEVTYLAPGERSGHDIELALDLDAGAPLQDWECRTHRVVAQTDDSGSLRIELEGGDRIPNRDFVLRYRVAGATVQPALVRGRDERGEYFALTLHPPAELEGLRRESIELCFVFDTSGSMAGEPIALSRAAMRRALGLLDARDSFRILRFSENASAFAPEALPATPANLARGLHYVESLEVGGGTMMIEGIRAALDAPRDPERQRVVAFLTDGYIGNEREILAEERRLLGSARVFSFGVGTSVNRFLLEAMAREGRGAAAFVGLSHGAAEVMASFLERIRRPALEDIRLEGQALAGAEVYPERIPDLFHGRPVTIVGRLPARSGARAQELELSGQVNGRTLRFPVRFEAGRAEATAMPWIFGRARIAALASRSLDADGARLAELTAAIRATALEYGLSSAFTAFIAVDSSHRTEGASGVTMPVPVPVPAGVRYDTTLAAPAGQRSGSEMR